MKDAAYRSGVHLTTLGSLVNGGFIGTGVRPGPPVMLDFRWIAVLEKASKRYAMKPMSEEDILWALRDMMFGMTDNISRQKENLERGHQLMSEDQIKKNLARYKRHREFLLEAMEWCESHRPKAVG